jgi:hypothetical protein
VDGWALSGHWLPVLPTPVRGRSTGEGTDPRPAAKPCPPASQRDDHGGLFAEANALACVLDVLMAGTETTSATLQWAVLLMARHPDVQGEPSARLGGLLLGGRGPQVSGWDGDPTVMAPILWHRPRAGGAGLCAGPRAAAPAGGAAVPALHQRGAARSPAVHHTPAPRAPLHGGRHPAGRLPAPQGGPGSAFAATRGGGGLESGDGHLGAGV